MSTDGAPDWKAKPPPVRRRTAAPATADDADLIRFACPTCRKSLKSPPGTAGAKTTCPKCGQRLRVPSFNKTTLGLPVPEEVPGSADAPDAPLEKPATDWGPIVDDVPAQDEAPTAPAAEGQSVAASPAPRQRFTRRFLRLALAAVLLAAVIVGATWLVISGGGLLPFSDEAVVRRYVLDNADDPGSVEFDRWGPNDDGRVAAALDKALSVVKKGFKEIESAYGSALPKLQIEVPELLDLLNLPPRCHIVRVRFRAKNKAGAKELFDRLYFVKDGKVVSIDDNEFGDDWEEKTLNKLNNMLNVYKRLGLSPDDAAEPARK